MTGRFAVLGLAGLVLLAAGCGSGHRGEDKAGGTPAGGVSGEAVVPAAASSGGDAPVAFAQCRTCHAVEPDRNGVGPSLHGVFGSPAASKPGFAYSEALKNAGLTWDRASLDKWLSGPVRMVPGARMVAMVPDAAQRTQVIDYLETLH